VLREEFSRASLRNLNMVFTRRTDFKDTVVTNLLEGPVCEVANEYLDAEAS
jgi:hypothetical protein